MAIKTLLERDGDKILASYSEVVDETTGLVVRGVWSRMEYGAYRTSFDGAQLEIGVEQRFSSADEHGVMTRSYIVQDLYMVDAAVGEPSKKWAVPSEKLSAAGELAIAAIELYASNLRFTMSVRSVVSLAPKFLG